MSQLETLVAKLQLLAAKPTLSSAENAEAQSVMQSLKALGMSNEEISKESQGKWSVSTVKGYTGGISAPSPSPWQDAVSALTDLIAANLSLDDIKAVLAVNHTLAAKKLTLENVVELLQTVAAAGLDHVHLINDVKALHQSGLSLKEAAGALALKTTMESHGLKLEDLPMLVKIAQQHGDAKQVLEAFSVYKSLTELQDEASATQNELGKIHAAQKDAEKKLEQIEAKSQKMQAPIKAYQKVLEYGFTTKVMGDLAFIAAKHGGPGPILQGFKDYSSLLEIKAEFAQTKAKLDDCESKISQSITKHGHLTSAIKMCETLIADYQFGIDALGTVLGVAKKFGEPVAVLKAIEAYGELIAIKKQADELAGTVAERQQLLAGLEAKFKEAFENLDKLYATVLSVGKQTGDLEGEFKATEHLQRLLDIIKNPEGASYTEHGQIVLLLAANLNKWVAAHATNFKWSTDNIKSGLKQLIQELSGTTP
jgi:DNA repair exonuclease SbcCD ATPase subunit